VRAEHQRKKITEKSL